MNRQHRHTSAAGRHSLPLPQALCTGRDAIRTGKGRTKVSWLPLLVGECTIPTDFRSSLGNWLGSVQLPPRGGGRATAGCCSDALQPPEAVGARAESGPPAARGCGRSWPKPHCVCSGRGPGWKRTASLELAPAEPMRHSRCSDLSKFPVYLLVPSMQSPGRELQPRPGLPHANWGIQALH